MNNGIFSTTEDAIYWASNSLQYQYDGAVIKQGMSKLYRDFEPIDVFLPLWRLIKSGVFKRGTDKIIMKYSLNYKPPSESSSNYQLWQDVVNELTPILIRKKVVHDGKGQ